MQRLQERARREKKEKSQLGVRVAAMQTAGPCCTMQTSGQAILQTQGFCSTLLKLLWILQCWQHMGHGCVDTPPSLAVRSLLRLVVRWTAGVAAASLQPLLQQ
jgi:hypothetical protein